MSLKWCQFLVASFALTLVSLSRANAQPVEFRFIDLFEVHDKKILWRGELDQFSKKFKLPNVQSLIAASEYNPLQELHLFYQDRDGKRLEITGKNRAEMIHWWKYFLESENASSVELLGNELVISEPITPHIHWKAVALKGGVNFAYWTLMGGSLVPERVIKSRFGQRLKLGKMRGALETSLKKRNCRGWIAAIGSRLPGPLTAVTLDLATRTPVARYELANQIETIQSTLTDHLRAWNQLMAQSPSHPRDLEMNILLPKILSEFQNLRLLADTNTADALAHLLGRESEISPIQGSMPTLFHKLSEKISKDREIVIATQSFTWMDDAHLDDVAKQLHISRSKLNKRIEELNSRLNQFGIRTPDSDLRRYQKLRSMNFSNLKTKSEFTQTPLVVNGEEVQDIDGQPIILDDFVLRLGLERRLQAAHYLYLYRDEFDRLSSAAATDLKLADSLRLASESSNINSVSPDLAYRDFLSHGSMSKNALDALNAELGFLRSLSAVQSPFKGADAEALIQRAEQDLILANASRFDELASRYTESLRQQLTEQYYSVASDGNAEALESLREPTPIPENYWDRLTRPKK